MVLQGVMRFLQTEWHKHERDRNNWEIERAEMKARIAKLEGENRAEKRLHQVHQARIKILERALKKERSDRALGEGKTLEDVRLDEEALAEKEKARGTSTCSSYLIIIYLWRTADGLFRGGDSGRKTQALRRRLLHLLAIPSRDGTKQEQGVSREMSSGNNISIEAA